MGSQFSKDHSTGDMGADKEKMRVYIDISQAAFTHFLNEAKEQGVPVKTLLSGEVEALYCIALEEKWREERKIIKDLIPDWDKGVPCEDTRSEMALTDKTVVKIFRKDYENIYFDKKYFKYFTDDTFEYRMPDSGNSLYVAYKGNLIATILRINVSK